MVNKNGKYQNKMQDDRITRLEDQFVSVCSKYNEEIGDIRERMAEIGANQKLLMYFMLLVLGGVVGLFFK